ncbi:hypothetical protein P692DRAFT_20835522 [Suillus brevipes Sb2]|nr:hypothetical protein P692DRAFT_20835522 [Suillus brevipes Sb2]
MVRKENTEARKLSRSHWVFDFDMLGSSLLDQGNHHSSIDSSRSPFPSKFKLNNQNLGEHRKNYLVEHKLIILTQYVSLPQPAQLLSKRQSLQPSLAASVADIKAATTAATRTKRIVREDDDALLYAVLYVGEPSSPEIHFQTRPSHSSRLVGLIHPLSSISSLPSCRSFHSSAAFRCPPHMFKPPLVAVGIGW